MSGKFEKLNKKIRSVTFIKALIFGLAVGLFASAGYAVVKKLMGTSPSVMYAAAIGGGVALIVFAIFILIARPTRKRIAKKLDERLSLNEKVQTMVEFDGVEGDMLEIQREDTQKILTETPRKQFRSRKLALHFVMPVLSIALAVCALLMPVLAKVEPEPGTTIDENDIWELADWEITAVHELIEKVNESEMYEDAKTQIVASLEKLLIDLAPVKSKTTMKQIVIATMIDIDSVVDDANTYSRIVKALAGSSNPKVAALADAIGSPADPINETELAALVASFSEEALQDELKAFARELEVAADSADVELEDTLYLALKNMAKAVSDYADNLGVAPAAEGAEGNGLSTFFEGFAEQISSALNGQHINRTVSDSTIDGLMIIFKISYSELPEELRVSDDGEAPRDEDNDYDDKDNDEILNPGGLGGGEVIYGSNDDVYDYKNDQLVNYGEVINEYNGKKETVKENSSFSDALIDFIDKYFADLYNKKETND